jgi:tRNA-(ms[2]io[6]A)-hydroxylase
VAPSSAEWVARACAELATLLVDHAHCEKRAASTAVRFLFKYPERPSLVTQLSRLAREELVHFERVLGELRARSIPFRQLSSAGYAAALLAHARGPVDELLVCALIEARSHERFEQLAAHVDDARLRDFYRELGEAEARHGEIYIELAEELQGGDVRPRLLELIAVEGEVVARPRQALRMHSG